MPIKSETIVDNLYDIALDPNKLENFIDVWTKAGLDSAEARRTVEAINHFDEKHEAHLMRALTLLERGEASDVTVNLTALLSPFAHLAAFVIDESLEIKISNSGAQDVFGLKAGTRLRVDVPPDRTGSAITETVSSFFGRVDRDEGLTRAFTVCNDRPLIIQVKLLSAPSIDGKALALVVTTNYRWSTGIGPTLSEVFGLTLAEQDVVRLLVEGRNVKEIAKLRGTSEGTARGQLKSILSKMNARSQSEVIRLVMNLQAVARSETPEANQPTITLGKSWLDAEVWKPFKTLNLPDGRRMDYHEMGPANGAPVLYSHMGYCMARWPAAMLKIAFAEGLRLVCPIRAGYGQSDNMDLKADVLATTRTDTLFLLDHLGLKKLPYVVQGNDLVFAMDLAAQYPDRVSEIIGLGARPFLHGDLHYAGMSKWHRFFLSTARHSPHLLRFTARASVSLMRRIGVEAMFKNAHKTSPPDMDMDQDQAFKEVLIANAELIA